MKWKVQVQKWLLPGFWGVLSWRVLFVPLEITKMKWKSKNTRKFQAFPVLFEMSFDVFFNHKLMSNLISKVPY